MKFYSLNPFYLAISFLLISDWICDKTVFSLDNVFSVQKKLFRFPLVLYSSSSSSSSPWWIHEEINFKCTGCGKCCTNDGEVWLDLNEFTEVAYFKSLSHEELLDKYSEKVMTDWVKLKDKTIGNISSCVFLDDKDGKSCTIYQHRPTQCRTYPYWPSLLVNRSAWEAEIVVPSGMEGKQWNPSSGGCEGISLIRTKENAISTTTIHQNLKLENLYLNSFPFMSSGDDRKRLLAKSSVIERVIKSTRSWVNDYVIKYKLCPFAEQVFKKDSVRYRVYLGAVEEKIIDVIKYEMLSLLTANEETISTTLLILPFAYPEFEDFYDFSLKLEDSILPILEKSCQVSHSNPIVDGDIQLAFFHNGFQWGGEEVDAAINYEKRSPFPVINLLRAKKIREYAVQGKVDSISISNQEMLKQIGSIRLQNELEALIRLAL